MRAIQLKQLMMTLLLMVGALSGVQAQDWAVQGVVIDAVSGDFISGAVVEISSNKHPHEKFFSISQERGIFDVAGLSQGQYRTVVSCLGYENAEMEFELTSKEQHIGIVRLRVSSIMLDGVISEAQAIQTSINGDTLSYNASAFKVLPDSDMAGLLKKMPGISVAGGVVEAHGETIRRVFVDGSEFFGEDVSSAIKSLPAQIIERVEVYDKLSDQAEFSGMDDGNGYKALNIITYRNMRDGQFGQFFTGYGYEPESSSTVSSSSSSKYLFGGNANIFKGSSRVSFIGSFNNVNQSDFSFADILGLSGSGDSGEFMVRPQTGVSVVNAVGLNYSDSWGEKDQVNFQGDYFYNGTNTINNSEFWRWYDIEDLGLDSLYSLSTLKADNYNNRINARLEWKINERQLLMIRPSVSFQTYESLEKRDGDQYNDRFLHSEYDLVDNFENAFNDGYGVSTQALYRLRLGKPGRTVSVNAGFNILDSNSERMSYGIDMSNLDAQSLQYLFTKSLVPSHSQEIFGMLSYTEPLAEHVQLGAQYHVSYLTQQRDKQTLTSTLSLNDLLPNSLLSSDYESDFVKHSVGPSLTYANNKASVTLSGAYQHSTLKGRVITDGAERMGYAYNDLIYLVKSQLYINPRNSLKLYLNSSTNTPSVVSLQGLYDVSDTQFISRGNTELQPSYSQSAVLRYIHSNAEKGRIFTAMGVAQKTSDYISTAIVSNAVVDVGGIVYRPIQLSQPVNVDGYWSLRGQLSYGFPVSFLRSNVNLIWGLSYSNVPSLIGGRYDKDVKQIVGGAINNTGVFGHNAQFVLGSNISKSVDFTFDWKGVVNETTNALSGNKYVDRYFNHSATGTLKAIFGNGLTFSANASYTQFIGYRDSYDDSYLVCNTFVGKRLFRNQSGELQLGVNDLFNQNISYQHAIGAGYVQNSSSSIMGRYFLIRFIFNLRNFTESGFSKAKVREVKPVSSYRSFESQRSTAYDTPPRM